MDAWSEKLSYRSTYLSAVDLSLNAELSSSSVSHTAPSSIGGDATDFALGNIR